MTTSSAAARRIRVLYAASSAYSGSTLLPFLLSSHPGIAGIGHTEGWEYGDEEEFRCSCGSKLPDCPFFRNVRERLHREGLNFEFRDFGMRFRVHRNERLNRWLTASLPLRTGTVAERVRDRFVRLVPWWAAALDRQSRMNREFMRAALAYHGAEVFADGAQDPFRLRHLGRTEGLEISVLHLVRDVRGVVFSNIQKKGWSAKASAHLWLRQQSNILRIASEFERRITIHYENLCDETNPTLESIHRFVGLEPLGISGGFRQGEHHILGNDMRLGENRIVKSTRWEREMSRTDLAMVERVCREFEQRRPDDPLSVLVRHYLDASPRT